MLEKKGHQLVLRTTLQTIFVAVNYEDDKEADATEGGANDDGAMMR
jgi:hypothetical protein